MRYNWSIYDIYKCIKTIENKIVNEKNIQKKNYYLQVLDRTKSIIYANPLRENRKDDCRNNKMIEVNDGFYSKGRYYDLISKYLNSVDLQEDSYDFYDLSKKIKAKRIKHDDALMIINNFFKDTDKELYKCFLELYDERYKSFRFVKNNMHMYNYEVSGSISFVDVVRKNYIYITDNPGITKLVTLAHECGHAVSYLYNPQIFYNYVDDFLGELPSTFFELLLLENIGIQMDEYAGSIISMEKLLDKVGICNKLDWHEIFINHWYYNNNKADKKFIANLQREQNLSIDEIDNIIDTDIYFSGSYAIAYFLSLELLGIYKQDKKEAFKILKRIINDIDKRSTLDIVNMYLPNFDEGKKEINHIQNRFQKIKK